MKVVTVVGARPQFIKAALVSHELRKVHQEVLVHTGQHYDFQMSQVFFDELAVPEPDYNLGIGSDTHARQTGYMMIAIEDVLLGEKPDVVLVYGDTNSTLAAALTATKLSIPVAHVEAGPRMYDMSVPEEVNRVVTDHVSTFLFAPTTNSVENLAKEGLVEGVHLTGDVMLDAFLQYGPVARQKSKVLERLGVKERQYLYVTVHRARNTDDAVRLETIVRALAALDTRIVLPVHPRTRKSLEASGLWSHLASARHITLCEPVGYLDSLLLTMNAKAVLTDSGGLQKEAYFAFVPCATLDSATAWPETVSAGWNRLTEPGEAAVLIAIASPNASTNHPDCFGSGQAATNIVRGLGL